MKTKNAQMLRSSMQEAKKRVPSFNLTQAAGAFTVGVFTGLLFFWPPILNFLWRPLYGPWPPVEGKCTQIIDADTIVVRNARYGDFTVDLASVVAPVRGEKFFAQALQFTTSSLLDQYVVVDPHLGWVYLGPQCFNSELIRAGYARYFHSVGGDEPLKALQDEAQKARRGLWGEFKLKEGAK